MYIPDPAFVRRLKNYDSQLQVRWMGNRWRQRSQREKWGIFRKVAGNGRATPVDVLILLVTDEQGNYAPLDERVLTKLRRGDTWKRGVKTIVDDFANQQFEAEDAQERAEQSETTALAQEMAPLAAKDAEGLGTLNIPKEDAQRMIEEDLNRRGTTYEEVMG